jgi:hypothetical protein
MYSPDAENGSEVRSGASWWSVAVARNKVRDIRHIGFACHGGARQIAQAIVFMSILVFTMFARWFPRVPVAREIV